MVDFLWAVRRHMVTPLLLYTADAVFRQNSTRPEPRKSEIRAGIWSGQRQRAGVEQGQEQEQEQKGFAYLCILRDFRGGV